MSQAVEKYIKKQKQILEAAKALFLRDGYGSTSMDSVAHEAKVTKQTVYRYFPSKKDLFEAVLTVMSPEGKKYRFGGGDVTEELQAFAEGFVKFHLDSERIGIYRLVISESAQIKELGSSLFNMSQSVRRVNLSKYLAKKLKTENPLKDAELLISMLLSIRSSFIMGISPMPSSADIKKHCEYSIELFINGRSKI